MKILFCLGSMSKGGAERVIANLSDYLAKANHQVSIITSVEKKSYYKLNKNVTLLGLDEGTPNKNTFASSSFLVLSKKMK